MAGPEFKANYIGIQLYAYRLMDTKSISKNWKPWTAILSKVQIYATDFSKNKVYIKNLLHIQSVFSLQVFLIKLGVHILRFSCLAHLLSEIMTVK